MYCGKCGAQIAEGSSSCGRCGSSTSPTEYESGIGSLQMLPVWALVLLHYITLGIFSVIWLNLYHGKLPIRRVDDPTGGKAVGYLFIPFYNLYWTFFTHMRLCDRINEERAKRGLKDDTLRQLAVPMCVLQVIPYVNLILWYLLLYPVFGGLLQASINELSESWTRVLPPDFVPESRPVRLEFHGTGLQYLGWSLLATLSLYLVIPTAWGFAAFWRWFVRSVRLSDGRQPAYQGDVTGIWWAFSLYSLLSLVVFAEYAVKDQYTRLLVGILISLAMLPGVIGMLRFILRRIIADVEVPSAGRPSFEGEYWPMLGWQALLLVSIYSIIGWAWAAAAATRWYCSKIRTSNERLHFLGKGHEILWRGILAYAAFFGIISIPWATKWFMLWFMENIAVIPAIPTEGQVPGQIEA